MKDRRFVLAYLVVICGIFCLFLFRGNDYTELVFSRESGFYKESFELKLYAPTGTKIYYTLDGSEPDENAILYTEPIVVDDASKQKNTYCMRTDVSAGFLRDENADFGVISNFEYKVPHYLIDKCTVVRAAYLDADGNFSDIRSASYFVDYDNKAGYEGINFISIITDPVNLFDYDTGIYVLGRSYDTSRFQEPVMRLYDANYYMRGMDWERNADVLLFDEGKKLLLSQSCGIRIQGGTSRHKSPKSINLYARQQYDNKGRFYADLFHTGYMADTITVSAGGDDEIAKCRDMLVSELTAGKNFSTMHYEPYAMFLNGEYWGVYWITEKYNDVYLDYYYGVEKDNVIMIKADSLSEGTEMDYATYLEMMDYMTHADLSVDENYSYACGLIDMKSYIDYYVTEIYIGQRDWPGKNEAMWRVREVGDENYNDGKWRWLLYDVNGLSILSQDYVIEDTLSITMDNSPMFRNLCCSEEFKKQFTITFMDFVNSTFSKQNVASAVSTCMDQMENAVNAHLKRFFSFEDDREYLAEMASIQGFFDERKLYITQYLKDNFGLNGTIVPVTIEVNDAAAGNIIVNTVELNFDEISSWSGEYYTDYPITLSAVANDGYRFVKWEGIDVSESDHINVDLSEKGIWVKAIFEKEE